MTVTQDLLSLDCLLEEYEVQTTGRLSKSRSRNNVHDWAVYAAATGASLTMSGYSEAAIRHVVPDNPPNATVFNPPRYPYSSHYFLFDLNGDGDQDMALGIGGGSVSFGLDWSAYAIPSMADASVMVRSVTAYGSCPFPGACYVAKLASGDTISTRQPFVRYGGGIAPRFAFFEHGGSYTQTYGEWSVAGDNYKFGSGIAGVKFPIAGNSHFGWIRVHLQESPPGGVNVVAVDEWAYNDVPGVPIRAGEIGVVDVPGDYDGNGTVGPEDYDAWQSQFGQSVTNGEGADGNGDGVVNAADYVVWRNAVATTSPGQTSVRDAIPEPGAITLGVLALGAIGISALRRRRAAGRCAPAAARGFGAARVGPGCDL